jgi:Cft2 family RNA processing exonuclease
MRFVALGGGQEVGASCYFLQVGATHILLDCGLGDHGVTSPNFSLILKPPFLESLNQLSQIYISHSHYDHVGSLKYLLTECSNAPVHATTLTKTLLTHVLHNEYDLHRRNSQTKREYIEILDDTTLQSIIEVDYCRPLTFPDYSVTFYEAGHIPGAAMMYFTFGERTVLYTGDFSCEPSALTSAYILPEGLKVDTLVMCAVHAKHPRRARYDRLAGRLQAVQKLLEHRQSVHLEVSQLTKGWEILKIINDNIRIGALPRLPVHIDRRIASLAERMERLHIQVMESWDTIAMPRAGERCLYIARALPSFLAGHLRTVKVDFSLHPRYSDLVEFVLKCRPSNLVLVHTEAADTPRDQNQLEIDLRKKYGLHCNVIYAKTGDIYTL